MYWSVAGKVAGVPGGFANATASIMVLSDAATDSTVLVKTIPVVPPAKSQAAAKQAALPHPVFEASDVTVASLMCTTMMSPAVTWTSGKVASVSVPDPPSTGFWSRTMSLVVPLESTASSTRSLPPVMFGATSLSCRTAAGTQATVMLLTLPNGTVPVPLFTVHDTAAGLVSTVTS